MLSWYDRAKGIGFSRSTTAEGRNGNLFPERGEIDKHERLAVLQREKMSFNMAVNLALSKLLEQ